jgi:hypothetical protein
MLSMHYYSDPAHGWYRVRRDVLDQYEVAERVSSCSYQNGVYVYLEEDCDAPLLIRAAEAAGTVVTIVPHKAADRDSSIRRMDRYEGGTK